MKSYCKKKEQNATYDPINLRNLLVRVPKGDVISSTNNLILYGTHYGSDNLLNVMTQRFLNKTEKIFNR